MSTLAVEFTASRMLQTVYGTSNIVWANVIGLVLLSLTAGYFLGGRLADRRHSHGAPELGRYFHPRRCGPVVYHPGRSDALAGQTAVQG